MKKVRTYLLLAYAVSVVTILFFIIVLSVTVYGGEVEGGIGLTDCAPWLMALMGLSGVFFSCRYLYARLISDQRAQKSLIDIVIILPALFMACIQLYAAFLFFAGI